MVPRVLAIGLLGLMLSGCERPIERNRPAGTLVLATAGDAQSLDPHQVTDLASMRMIENLHGTLLRYGDVAQGELLGDLATEWHTSDDGRRLTLTLDPDRRFHTGRPVTSDAVRASLRRIQSQGVRGGNLAVIERIETPDRWTVELELREPSAALPTHLAHPMNAILDDQQLAGGDPRRFAEAGCGAYRLTDWQRGRRMLLEAAPGRGVGPDHLELRPMPDALSRSLALRTGEVDGLEQVPAHDAKVLETAQDVRLQSVPGTFWEYIGLNTTQPPLDDVRVRQAIAWAVDRDALIQAVKFGRATALRAGPIPPDSWAALDEAVYPARDLDRARALLHEAGWSEGLGLVMIVNARRADQVWAGEMLKQQLAEAGIRVTLEALEPGVFYQRLNRRDFQCTVVGWSGFVEPDEFVAELFHSDGAYNQQGFSDDEVDRLIEAARRSPQREERIALYHTLQRRIAELAPMVFLYVNPEVVAHRTWVTGLEPHTSGSMRPWTQAAIQAEGRPAP